jgi:hypothetical protein
MSQQTLEILSDERIAPSLLEPEYPEIIASVGSIDSKDSIVSEDFLAVEYSRDSEDSFDLEYSLDSGYFLESETSLELENSLASKYSLDSGDSIFFRETEVDSLTGIPNDPTANARVNGSRPTTALRNPGLDITTFSYSNQALVTATVKVELSPVLQFYIQQDWLDITLQCSVWGMDGGFFGNGNDHLFNFSDKIITGEGNYTFSGYVNRSVLNEDRSLFNNTDEIAAKFTLKSSDPAVPVNLTAWTNIVTGRY